MTSKEYRFNPMTGSMEPVETREQIIKKLLKKGKQFDDLLLLYYGEQQHLFAK